MIAFTVLKLSKGFSSNTHYNFHNLVFKKHVRLIIQFSVYKSVKGLVF